MSKVSKYLLFSASASAAVFNRGFFIAFFSASIFSLFQLFCFGGGFSIDFFSASASAAGFHRFFFQLFFSASRVLFASVSGGIVSDLSSELPPFSILPKVS
jgi:hypothetical protein